MSRPMNVIELRKMLSDLKRFDTSQLVDELITREGVETYISMWGSNSIEATIMVIKK